MNVLEYAGRPSRLFVSSSRVYSIPALAAIPLRARNAFAFDATAKLPRGLSVDGIGVDFSTAAPVSLYGATKLASEIIALEYGEAFGFPVWITRCGVLAGAGQFGTPDQGFSPSGSTRTYGADGFATSDSTAPATRRRRLPPSRPCGPVGRSNAHGSIRWTTRLYGRRRSRHMMSLAQLTTWCNERFGCHVPFLDPEPRMYDIRVAMDDTGAARDSAGVSGCFTSSSRRHRTTCQQPSGLAGIEPRIKSQLPAPLRWSYPARTMSSRHRRAPPLRLRLQRIPHLVVVDDGSTPQVAVGFIQRHGFGHPISSWFSNRNASL